MAEITKKAVTKIQLPANMGFNLPIRQPGQ
jgi:hypothetical protein